MFLDAASCMLITQHVQTILHRGLSLMDMDSGNDHVKKCTSSTIVPSSGRIMVNERFPHRRSDDNVSALSCYVRSISSETPGNSICDRRSYIPAHIPTDTQTEI
jgi:hypothetical protein